MILQFMKQFVPLIVKHSKIHTIREDEFNRWKEGRKIHMATGVRTANYNQFREAICTGTQKIQIFAASSVRVYIDNKFFYEHSLLQRRIDFNYGGMLTLAKNDGFATIEDFFEWFNKDFTGKIIHWTDYRY